MSQWGRKIYQSWPSRHPVWTLSAFFGAVVFFMLALATQYARSWSFVERFYLPVYAKTWMHGLFPKAQTRYSLIAGVTAKGQQRLALGGEVEATTNTQGQPVYVLTEEGRRNGLVRLTWDTGVFNDWRLHEFLGHWIYRDQTVWDYIERPAYAALGAFVLLLFIALPRDWSSSQRLRPKCAGLMVCGATNHLASRTDVASKQKCRVNPISIWVLAGTSIAMASPWRKLLRMNSGFAAEPGKFEGGVSSNHGPSKLTWTQAVAMMM